MKLHKRIVSIVITLSLLANSIFLIAFINLKKIDAINNLNQKISNTSKLLSLVNSVPLYDGDIKELRVNLKSFANDDEIASISLFELNGDIKITYRKESLIKTNTILEVSDITYNDIQIGTIETLYTTSVIDKSLSNYFIQLILSFLIITLLICSTIYILLRKITSPLRDLTELASEIASGNLDKKISITGENEIGTLSRSLILMRDSIKQKIESLRKENSERKKAEESLKERTSELAVVNNKLEHKKDLLEDLVIERTTELQQYIDRLKETQNQLVESEKLASLGALVAGIAHEINTPIGISVTASSHLEDRTKEFEEHLKTGKLSRSEFEKFFDDAKSCSKLIFTHSQRAATLINSFKKVAVDQSSSEMRSFELKEYLEEVLVSLKPKFKNTNFNIELNCPNNITLFSYPGALTQILTNFLINSLLHGFEGLENGTIFIDIKEVDDRIYMIYRDTGCGIPDDNLHKIFDPFFTTKRGKGGSGLGLHIGYNLVSQTLMGSIKCNSKKNSGTSFEMIFPARLNSEITV